MITNKAVNEAIDFILLHINEDLTVDDIAAHCHFSKYYFSRLFRSETGESIYSFIKRLRVEQGGFSAEGGARSDYHGYWRRIWL